MRSASAAPFTITADRCCDHSDNLQARGLHRGCTAVFRAQKGTNNHAFFDDLHPAQAGAQRPAGRVQNRARHGADPCLPERCHRWCHQGRPVGAGSEGYRRAGHAVQHLPSASASRRQAGSGYGRPAQVYPLERAYPDRQRRISGVQSGKAAQDHRGGRDLRLPSGRAPHLYGARGEHADSGKSGLYHRHGL